MLRLRLLHNISWEEASLVLDSGQTNEDCWLSKAWPTSLQLIHFLTASATHIHVFTPVAYAPFWRSADISRNTMSQVNSSWRTRESSFPSRSMESGMNEDWLVAIVSRRTLHPFNRRPVRWTIFCRSPTVSFFRGTYLPYSFSTFFSCATYYIVAQWLTSTPASLLNHSAPRTTTTSRPSTPVESIRTTS